MNAIVGRAGQVSLDIRPMRAADVPAVMVSELAAYPHPWTEGIFRDCLRVGYYCVVGETGRAPDRPCGDVDGGG